MVLRVEGKPERLADTRFLYIGFRTRGDPFTLKWPLLSKTSKLDVIHSSLGGATQVPS